MPATVETSEILNLLDAKTRKGSLRWQVSGRDGEFIARVRGYSVVISINRLTEMFSDRYKIKSPVTVQYLLPEGFELARIEVRPEQPEYEKVRGLYDEVARSAEEQSQLMADLADQLRELS